MPSLLSHGLNPWTLLKTFTINFPTTPAHCRLPLFQTLVNTCGNSHLSTVAYLLLTSFTDIQVRTQAKEFTHQLFCVFQPLVQVQNLPILLGLLSNNSEESMAEETEVENGGKIRIGEWLKDHLSHLDFLETLLELSETQEENVQKHLVELFIVIFRYLDGFYSLNLNDSSITTSKKSTKISDPTAMEIDSDDESEGSESDSESEESENEEEDVAVKTAVQCRLALAQLTDILRLITPNNPIITLQ